MQSIGTLRLKIFLQPVILNLFEPLFYLSTVRRASHPAPRKSMLNAKSMKLKSVIYLSCLCLGCMVAPYSHALSLSESSAEIRHLSLENEPWTGDFEQMLDRRLIRVLVPYSRTLYFLDKGQERGLSADLVRDFERYINKKYAKALQKRPITVVMIPTTRDRLLDDLVSGFGDIAVGNITVTPERLAAVDFFAPRDRQLSELFLLGAGVQPVLSLNDLAGRTVHVRKSSSYFESLNAVNERLHSQNKLPMQLINVPEALEDEDLMEMLNAGTVDNIVVDDWKARVWSRILPNITVSDFSVRDLGHSGWAFRHHSPGVQQELSDFYINRLQKNRLLDNHLVEFNRNIQQVVNNVEDKDWQRFEEMQSIFEKYGAQYRLDPLMLAAQGFQESQLRQNKRGPSGAVGVMQLLPSTARSLNVGNIALLEPNIHASAKYLDQLMSRYFGDAQFQDNERTLFAIASYNAGPGTISRLRNEAMRQGLDPDRWFNNVELVVADKVGWETTTYVRNIYKYYAAYKMQLQIAEYQRQARSALVVSSREPQ